METQAPDSRDTTAPKTGLADDVLTDQPNCVIISGPGGGKSSLLRTRLIDGVTRWQNGHCQEVLPVLVHAAALAEHTLTDALAAAGSGGLPSPLPETFFRHPPRPGGRWLVLLDGLDEVPDPAHRKNILRKVAVATSGDHAHLYRFVIATRPLPDDELDALGKGVPRYGLEPFTHGDLETVARAWFQASRLPDPADTAKRFVQELHRRKLADLACVPLMAAMLCQLHAATIGKGLSDPALPSNRGQIYRDFIALLRKSQPVTDAARYPGLERHPEAHDRAETVLAHLQDLIARLAAERQTGSTLSALTIVQSQPEAECPEEVRGEDWRTFLDASLRRSGLLAVRGGDLVFLHQTIQEHLAARHLMSNRRIGRQTLRDAFPKPLSFEPRTLPAILLVMSAWRWRYWVLTTVNESYLGFVLDEANRGGFTRGNRYLRRLTRGYAGLKTIITMYELRTTIPEAITRTTFDSLADHARDSRLNDPSRIWAAEKLAELGDARGCDLLHNLARNDTIAGHERVWAAEKLAELGDARGCDLLHNLARNDTPVIAGARMAEAGDARGCDLLHDLACDVLLDRRERLEAAARLAELGDARGSDLLHHFACNDTLRNDTRVEAAARLAEVDDARGSDLLHNLAQDNLLNGYLRVEAAARLAEVGDARGSDLLHNLARNDTLRNDTRVRAAEKLAKLS